MLAQKDAKPIPFGMIPNGSGNDAANSIGVDLPTKGLDWICSGTITKIDYGKALVDVENEEDIPQNENPWNYMRLFNNSVGFATVPRIAMGAKPWKACCGTGSYKISALKLACCSTLTVPQKMYCDGKAITIHNSDHVWTMVSTVLNSKW